MRLTVSDLRFSYNDHAVLKDVTFELEQRQIMCVLGLNGAGKSTLLKCLNGILKPQHGRVAVDGKDLLGMRHTYVAKQIGYVPQRHEESRLTVFETVLTGRTPHIRWSLGRDDYAVVEEIIEQIGIAHLAMRSVADLSGGEFQKVIIARALAQAPAILLLDEPTSNLDLKNQLEVMGLIRSIVATKGLSAVVAIHDLNIALRFGDLFVFLKDQRIHATSRKEDLAPEMIRQVYGVDVTLLAIGEHTVVAPL